MELIKSLNASVVYRTFAYQGHHVFSVGIVWPFALTDSPGQVVDPVLEQDLWSALSEVPEGDGSLDAAMPKERGEFLVYGAFHAPRGTKVASGTVRVVLGKQRKDLAVFGDRIWGDTLPSRPVEIEQMPLNYPHAFGGDGFPANPEGLGAQTLQDEHGSYQPLPNVELVGQTVTSPRSRPRPGAYGRIDPSWQPRSKLTGTYDEAYLRNRLPGLPDDIDWRFFNEAAEDQWADGFYRGDESYELHNMNPDHEVFRGQLPEVAARCFINQEKDDGTEFREIKTQLDTVVFLPGAGIGALIHRGTTRAGEFDGTDIKHLLIGHELMGQARDPEHYETEFRLRTDRDSAFKYALYSVPLIPQGYRCAFDKLTEDASGGDEGHTAALIDTYAAEREAYMEAIRDEKLAEVEKQKDVIFKKLDESDVDASAAKEAMEKATAAMKERPPADRVPEKSEDQLAMEAIIERILPGALTNPSKPDLTRFDPRGFEELQEYILAMVERTQQQAVDKARANMAGIREAGGGDPFEKMKAFQNIDAPDGLQNLSEEELKKFDLEEVLRRFEEPPPAPSAPPPLPRARLTEQIISIRGRITELEDQIKELSSRIKDNIPENLPAEEADKAASAFDLEVLQKQLMEMEQQVEQAERDIQRAYALTAHAIEGSSPHPGEEAGIREQLLARYAKKQSMAWSDFAYIDLRDEDLSGADLSNCYLEYADLRGATLRGANLSGSVLCHARLENTDLRDCDLSSANLGASRIVDCDFDQADLSDVIWGKAELIACRLRSCRFGERSESFLESRISECDFSGSTLARQLFLEIRIEKSRFDECDFADTSFLQCQIKDCSFDKAKLPATNFVGLEGSGLSFRSAQLINTRFVGQCSLPETQFDRATIHETNLRECTLANACFEGADLWKSDLGSSDLSGCRFDRAKARETQFLKSKLDNASLRRADLMEASLMASRLVGTDFSGANLYSVSFLDATLGKTRFLGANLDKTILKDWRPVHLGLFDDP